MTKDEQIVKSLIAGGVIGAALGALLSKEKGAGAVLGAIAGAALLSTFKANEKALQTNLPVYVEEHGDLYELHANGERKFIKKIDKITTQVPENFKLK